MRRGESASSAFLKRIASVWLPSSSVRATAVVTSTRTWRALGKTSRAASGALVGRGALRLVRRAPTNGATRSTATVAGPPAPVQVS